MTGALSRITPAFPAFSNREFELLEIEEASLRERCSVATTSIVPPCPAPLVSADIAPPFWSMTELAFTKIFPPAPEPCVSVKKPLPGPSIRTDSAGLSRPWIVMLPALPEPVLLAETDAPFEIVKDCPAERVMFAARARIGLRTNCFAVDPARLAGT